MHGWGEGDPVEESAAVLMIRDRVGPQMKLMLDPASHLRTFADTITVGHACDEANYFWLEDPYRDTGVSQSAHRLLRERIKTPLLMGEHIRGLETKADFAVSGATDFVRVNPDYDMGITGALKVGHMAESLGLDVEVHSTGPAHRHCVAAFRNTNFYELALVGPKSGTSKPAVYTDGYSDDFESVGKDGQFPVPTGPGLGVQYDWDFIRKNAKNSVVLQ
jgi:L-alanine-DL-glutamate epimerase-like enolase superfamily enzyme